MNIHNLIKSLNKLCDELNKLYNINCGGCCYVAYLIASHLEKLKIEYSLIVLTKEKKNSAEINKEISTMKTNRINNCSITRKNTCSHYYIYIKNIGNINKAYSSYRRYVIDPVKAVNIHWIYKTGDWNSFYLKKNNKILKTEFDNFFRPYEKEEKRRKSCRARA